MKQLLKGCEVERRKYEKLVEEIIGDKIEFFAGTNEVFMMDVKQLRWYTVLLHQEQLDKSDVLCYFRKAQQACAM